MKVPKALPNLLTLSRLLMSVPLAYYLFHERIAVALGILLAAGITDLLDGLIAREFHLRTTLGSWLDPAADKVMITTVLVTLTIMREVPIWFCVLTIARDLSITFGALVLVLKGVDVKISPLLTGKLATVGQNVVLLMAILKQFTALQAAFHAAVIVSAVLTAVSFVTYTRQFYKLAREFEEGAALSP